MKRMIESLEITVESVYWFGRMYANAWRVYLSDLRDDLCKSRKTKSG